jgi:hypothetical protein
MSVAPRATQATTPLFLGKPFFVVSTLPVCGKFVDKDYRHRARASAARLRTGIL